MPLKSARRDLPRRATHTAVFLLLALSGYAEIAKPEESTAVAASNASSRHEDCRKLVSAARSGRVEEIVSLIAKGANVDDFCSGRTPLMAASRAGQKEAEVLLLEKGANANAKTEVLSYRLQRAGKDVGYTTLGAETALMMTSERGHKEITQLLVDRGADVDARDENGYSPLMFAAEEGHKDIVDLLIGRGADVDARGYKSGKSALALASKASIVKVLRIQVDKRNAQRSVPFASGNTDQRNENVREFTCAVQANDAKWIESLIDRGMDVNARNQKGSTALMTAAREGQTESAKVLIAKGADVNATNEMGDTALMIAAAEPVNDFETADLEVYARVSSVAGSLGGLIQTVAGGRRGAGGQRTKRSGCAA